MSADWALFGEYLWTRFGSVFGGRKPTDRDTVIVLLDNIGGRVFTDQETLETKRRCEHLLRRSETLDRRLLEAQNELRESEARCRQLEATNQHVQCLEEKLFRIEDRLGTDRVEAILTGERVSSTRALGGDRKLMLDD